MGGDTPVESGDSGGGTSAESGIEAGEPGPADKGDGTGLVEGGDADPAEGSNNGAADGGESGEVGPAKASDGAAPNEESGDTGEVDEEAAEQSAIEETAPVEAGEGEPATNEIGPYAGSEPRAEPSINTETPPRPAGLPPDVQMPNLPAGLPQKALPHNPGDSTPTPNVPNVLPKPGSNPSKEMAPGQR
jgi:hypothetical protein